MNLRSLFDPGDWLAIKPTLDPSARTLELNYRPEPFEIKLRFIVGLAVTTLASLAGYAFRDDGVALFVACGFALFGLLNLIYGTLQFRFSLSVTFTSLEVAVQRNTLWGASQWRESLRNFLGVLMREEEIEDSGSGRIRRMKRYSIIELLHSDPSKTLPLHVTLDGPSPADIQHAFARRFHLPELTFDLVPAADPGPPPSRVIVREVDGVTCFAIAPGLMSRLAPWLFWPLFPFAAGAFASLIDPEMVPFVAAAAAALVAVLLAISWMKHRGSDRAPRGICVGRDAVWLGTPAESRCPRIPLQSIRHIRLDRMRGTTSGARAGWYRIIIDAGDRRLEFSGGLFDRARLAWIRDRLRSLR